MPKKCPHCGRGLPSTSNGKHISACSRVPPDIGDLFLEETLYLNEWAEELDVSSSFIRVRIARELTKEQISARVREIRQERGGSGQGRKKRKPIKPTGAAQCRACMTFIFDDPRQIPKPWRGNWHWHINVNGFCPSCAGGPYLNYARRLAEEGERSPHGRRYWDALARTLAA